MRRLALAAGSAASLIVVAAARSAPPPAQAVANPLQGRLLYVNPAIDARRQAAVWQNSRPDDAARMLRVADQPHAIWLGEWDGDVRHVAEMHSRNAERSRRLPVFVAYNIPYRDCGLHSRGGARTATDYRRWVIAVARGLGGRPSVVILEPDAVAAIDCLPARLADERYSLLAEAASVLTKAGAFVYIDAGNAHWQQVGEIASRLTRAGIASAHGFALNVSNFHATDVNVQYGARVSQLVGGKHYVIDTSRNGRGAQVEREWCNAPGQALGYAPTTTTGVARVDAFLWVKTPGQSDGTCNGGPRAGQWWPEYALGLAQSAERLGSMALR